MSVISLSKKYFPEDSHVSPDEQRKETADQIYFGLDGRMPHSAQYKN